MSVEITVKSKAPAKAKAKSKAAAQNAAELAIVQLVDQIVAVNPPIEAAKEPKKLQDKARKELLDLVGNDYTPEDAILLKGTTGQVKFSPFSHAKVCVDPKKVHEMLGDEAFYNLVKLGVTDLNKYLTPSQLALVMQERWGSRSMTVMPLND